MEGNVIDADFMALNEETAKAVEARRQGQECVLLINGSTYYDVHGRDGDEITVSSWNGYFTTSLAKLEAEGFKATKALLIVKDNGTYTYLVKTEDGTDVYSAGKKFPAVRKRR